MKSMYYVGLDIHKSVIVYCIKSYDGIVFKQGRFRANRPSLSAWIKTVPGRWSCAMEATMFTGWVYDFLLDYAHEIKVAHPAMLKAITAAKKKNDRDDAERLCDLLRVNLLPECYIAPGNIRELRRVLRFRKLIVGMESKMKNRIAGMLMEVGGEYDKRRLHGKRYFYDLLDSIEHVPESVISLMKISRNNLELFNRLEKQLIAGLRVNPLIAKRVQLLTSIPAVGKITALTWVLEIGEIERFSSRRKAISYCGLCSAQNESAGKTKRGPISKKRNKHLQTTLIEAAKLAPRWNEELAAVYDSECLHGNSNRATIAVARKLVSFMLAVDRRGTPFIVKKTEADIVTV